MSNLFEIATQKKFRFQSQRGDLTVEDLWDLPLTSKHGFDLDTVAKLVNKDLKAATEESFVSPATAVSSRAAEKLEIVKHVIAVRLAEIAAVQAAGEKAAKKQKLLELLEKKQDEALGGLTAEQIQEQIAALG